MSARPPGGDTAHDRPLCAVDVGVAVLTIRLGRLGVLCRRLPGRGRAAAVWALPACPIEVDPDDTAARLVEVAGATGAMFVEQLRTYARTGASGRRGAAQISIAYVALLAQIDAPEGMRVFDVEDLRGSGALRAPDERTLGDAIERVRAKFEYTNVATSLLTEPFTIPELRRVYEAVWGVALHPANFRRKVLATPGFVVAQDRERGSAHGRAAGLYRRGSAVGLHPAMLRTGSDSVRRRVEGLVG